jgi:acetylornithine deacetylase/succinyl-diaminopimelate desuccinylase-like protein
MVPGENPDAFLDTLRRTVNDPAVGAEFVNLLDPFPPARPSALGSAAFKAIEAEVMKHYQVPTIPMMGTGATDMAFMRARGSDCYGIGPATDVEDGPRGFGAHSDQERILEAELYRYVQFVWDLVNDLAASAR